MCNIGQKELGKRNCFQQYFKLSHSEMQGERKCPANGGQLWSRSNEALGIIFNIVLSFKRTIMESYIIVFRNEKFILKLSREEMRFSFEKRMYIYSVIFAQFKDGITFQTGLVH